MRITRREFIKYCAAAAGALGLTTTDLLKLEKAMATSAADGGTQVVWLNGASCTGCTVSLANSAYYSSIQDLLVPWTKAIGLVTQYSVDVNGDPTGYTTAQVLDAIDGDVLTHAGANGPLDLVFMETLSSAVGYRALDAAKTVLTSHGGSNPFVLCVEGSIQTETDGYFCRIGDGTAAGDTTTISFADEVQEYATDANCLAILAVGTCASFGGIPASKGSETGARGLISTGKISGGYKTTDNEGFWDTLKGTAEYGIISTHMSNYGSGYTSAPSISFSGTGATTTPASGYDLSANINVSTGQVTSITIHSAGTGFTGTPILDFNNTGTGGTGAAALATIGAVSGLSVAQWTDLMSKTVCISGCPPHPDWIVGTIVYLLTYGEPPLTDKWHRPTDFYAEYQCDNCLWQTNIPGKSNVTGNSDMKNIDGTSLSNTTQGDVTGGNSPKLYKYKYNSMYEGCLGVMGCKGRKTKADCSFRRWNSDTFGGGGVGWCVQTRAGCHGCTDPRFPDGWGKFFAFK